MEINKIIQGDCLEVLKTLPDDSIDAVITDPPYGLTSIVKRFGKEGSAPAQQGKDGSFARLSGGFMGKLWDGSGIEYNVDMWSECLRVLKPGGHLLSFGGTRTYHRMACAIEDAGFEIRDMIEWVYGSGFPKSLNIGKAVDKLQGNEREVVGYNRAGSKERNGFKGDMAIMPFETKTIDLEVTKGTSEWEGWGTALKPSHEPICMARKPLSEKTVAENVLKYGTGGINIDESRVETSDNLNGGAYSGGERSEGDWKDNSGFKNDKLEAFEQPQGRFPANIITDGSEEVRECFPDSKAGSYKGEGSKSGGIWSESTGKPAGVEYGDSGNASRFFKSIVYTAKASKSERNMGCEGLEEKEAPGSGRSKPAEGRKSALGQPRTNHHPTVKPVALMEYLIKMVTPTGGIVLDPFMGSGTTGVACKKLGRDFIGIELDENYFKIARARIKAVPKTLF